MSAWAQHPLAHRLSRYVNSWARNRPRLIRRRVLRFPPIRTGLLRQLKGLHAA